MDEKRKMLDGEFYDGFDAILVKERQICRSLLSSYNALYPNSFDDVDMMRKVKETQNLLFGSIGKNCFIEPPFRCDYGKNIYMGSEVYMNFNCVILDCAKVTIGDRGTIALKNKKQISAVWTRSSDLYSNSSN